MVNRGNVVRKGCRNRKRETPSLHKVVRANAAELKQKLSLGTENDGSILTRCEQSCEYCRQARNESCVLG